MKKRNLLAAAILLSGAMLGCSRGARQPPVISSFTATPATIAPGGQVTLTWAVSPGATLSLLPAVGAVTGNSNVVMPPNTTTYALTATNERGSAVAHVTVTVEQPPPGPAQPAGRKSDVAEMLERLELCQHWTSEEPYSEERRQQIEAGIKAARCEAFLADLTVLKRKYADDPGAVAQLREAAGILWDDADQPRPPVPGAAPRSDSGSASSRRSESACRARCEWLNHNSAADAADEVLDRARKRGFKDCAESKCGVGDAYRDPVYISCIARVASSCWPSGDAECVATCRRLE